MSMQDDNKARCQTFYNLINEGNLDRAVELVTADFRDHNPPPIEDLPRGPEGLKRTFETFAKAFHGLRVEVKDMIAEGDKVAVRLTWSGKHQGSLMGETPTGKMAQGEAIDIIRIKDGKAAERWGLGNDAEVMAKLGVEMPTQKKK